MRGGAHAARDKTLQLWLDCAVIPGHDVPAGPVPPRGTFNLLRLLDESIAWHRMLETIREFALEQLDAHGETGAIRRRHAEYVRDAAEQAQPHLLVPAERGSWL